MNKKLIIAVIIFGCALLFSQGGNNFGGGGGTISSGTTNTLPKYTAATTVGNSALSDNGTTVTSTEAISVPIGSAAAPTFKFTGGKGFYADSFGEYATDGTNTLAQFTSGGIGSRVNSDYFCSNISNCDVVFCRNSPGVWNVSNSSLSCAALGFVKTVQTLQVAANFTTSSATLVAVTGLTFTDPPSFATSWSFRCDLVYSQATAAAANLFGIITTQTAPTSLLGFGEVYTSLAGANVDGSAVITTATSTTLATATPSAFGAIGTTADMFAAHIWGTVEAPSNASPTQVGIAVATGNVADALTIYRGSACWFY